MDLRELMQSPSVALEPTPALDTVVRREAGRLLRRRRAAGGVLVAAALLGGAVTVPALIEPDMRVEGPAHSPAKDYGVTTATSEVVLLEQLNGADVVAWFEGNELCTASIRVKRDRTCAPAVNPASTEVFPLVLPLTTSSLRVDGRRLIAGLVRTDVRELFLDLEVGSPLVVTAVSGEGFPFAVWFVELPKGAVPAAVRSVGSNGIVLGRRAL